jgi:DNA-binding CsgD family transcriptional regulator
VDLNQFLLDLYRMAPSTPSSEFGGAVLERLKREVPFDTGLWGTFTGTPQGPRPHWAYLHGLPDEMLREYELVKQHDVLNARLIANPGRTTAISLARAQRLAHPDVIVHARRWGMENTLATVVLESPLNLYTIVSLYRRDPRRTYSERERRFKQAVLPHLVAAWHMNAMQFLDAPEDVPRTVLRARARIDAMGVIHNADTGLVDLLRREMAGWSGPLVPSEVLAGVQGPRRRYDGRQVVVSCVRTLRDRTLVISARLRAPVDALSEREREVAREFASGRTYKEIAALFGTSPMTVRSQIQAAYTKLGVRTKVDLGKHLED